MISKKNTTRISDLVFENSLVALLPSIEDGSLSWSLTIETNPQNVEGESWSPRLYSESLLQIEGKEVNEWSDAFSNPLQWNACIDSKLERPNALLYVFEHAEVYQSELTIDAHSSGAFALYWKAQCDVFFSDDYSEKLDLEVLGSGTVDRVLIGKRGESVSESDAYSQLRNCIKAGEFEFEPAENTFSYSVMRMCS